MRIARGSRIPELRQTVSSPLTELGGRYGLIDEMCHFVRLRVIPGKESRYDTQSIGLRSILTDLPFTQQLEDGNFYPDNSLNHVIRKLARRIRYLPRKCLSGFVDSGELIEVLEQPCLVLNDERYPVGMNHGIVPRWHGFAVGMLARIPRRSDIGVRTLKDDDRRYGLGKQLPDGVRTSDVAQKRPVLAAGRINQKGQVVYYELPVAMRGPGSQWMGSNQSL